MMSIDHFRQDAERVLRHFDLRRSAATFEMHVDHVYSGDPVARAWAWSSAGDEREHRACAQMMVTLRIVAERDWHVIDFSDAALQHRRPQAGASALGRAHGEWHILAFHGVGGGQAVAGGYMLVEHEADYLAVRDELLRPIAA